MSKKTDEKHGEATTTGRSPRGAPEDTKAAALVDGVISDAARGRILQEVSELCASHLPVRAAVHTVSIELPEFAADIDVDLPPEAVVRFRRRSGREPVDLWVYECLCRSLESGQHAIVLGTVTPTLVIDGRVPSRRAKGTDRIRGQLVPVLRLLVAGPDAVAIGESFQDGLTEAVSLKKARTVSSGVTFVLNVERKARLTCGKQVSAAEEEAITRLIGRWLARPAIAMALMGNVDGNGFIATGALCHLTDGTLYENVAAKL